MRKSKIPLTNLDETWKNLNGKFRRKLKNALSKITKSLDESKAK